MMNACKAMRFFLKVEREALPFCVQRASLCRIVRRCCCVTQRRKRKSMEIKEFAEKVCTAMRKEFGDEYRIELKEIKKNNGVVLHGMLISSQAKNVVPTIYLEAFLEAYESGTTFAEIIRRLTAIYREDTPKDRIDMDFFHSFDGVKDRICYRLIGRKGNEELLEEIPYVEFLDLAVCFYYAYQGEALGEGTILVRNSHQEMWKASTAELMKLAQSNTPRLFPCKCNSLEDILKELAGWEVCAEAEEAPGGESFGQGESMWVLSNTRRVQGAVCMLYPGVLEGIAAEGGRGIYILPSSIHEVILLTDLGQDCAGELKRMIVEVNNTQVAPEEVLSDSLYYYDFAEKRVKKIF